MVDRVLRSREEMQDWMNGVEQWELVGVWCSLPKKSQIDQCLSGNTDD